MLKLLLLTLIFIPVSEAGAATYYFASGPATISNIEDPADRVKVATGRLDVDKNKFGGSLAGKTIEADEFGLDGASASFAFGDLSVGGVFSVTFDAAENISDYFFLNETFASFRFSVASFGVSFTGGDGEPPFDFIDQHLQGLGYHPGSPAYIAQFCGVWADDTCNPDTGLPSNAWALAFAAEPGSWFTDEAEWNAAVGSTVATPRSYYDIAPIPLPASLAFVLAGIAGLVLVRKPWHNFIG